VVSSDPRVDLAQLIDNKLINELKRATGVGNVMAVHGSAKREVTVTIDEVRFKQSGLTLDGIAGSLAASNVNFPVGDLRQGRMTLTVRVPAEFKSVEEIRQVPVGFAGMQVIRLGDIADVMENLYEQPIALRANGTEGSFLIIQKRSNANTVQTANNIEEIVGEIEEAYPYVSFITVFNTADIITTSINNLLRTLLIAFALVVLISFLLLGNSSAGWITSITIPISLIAAFIYLYFSGGSINIISLSSLAITIGMVVDNGIVVLENIFRQREKGREQKSAAEWGVKEVVQAVMASTLTTVAIFIPFLLVKGFIGIYFKELAFSVPIILFASLATAITLTPMLASRFLKMQKKRTKRGKLRVLQWIPAGLDKLAKWYRGVLDWSLSHRWVIIVSAVALFAGGMGLFATIPTSFMAGGSSPFIQGEVELPAGTRFEVTDSIVSYIETEISENYGDEIEDILVMGGDYSGQMGDETGSEAKAEIFLTLKDDLKRSEDDIAQDINQRFADLAGLKRLYFVPRRGGPTGGGKAISLEIYGYDIPTTDSLAAFFADSLGNIPGFIGIEISRESTNPEMWLEVDKERAYAYGLTPAQVGMHLRNVTLGKVATEVAFAGDKLEVVLRFAGAEDWTQLDFESMTIPTPMGGVVPLSNLVRFVPHEGPASIERKEGERLIKVETDLYELPLGSAKNEITKIINGMDFPFGTRAEISGQAEDQAESFQSLFFALIVGIVLVFLVMAAQFENFREPFIVLFAIPFAMTGVAIALKIGNSTLDIMSFVGMILLVGVVVNNAIVLIDYINLLRRRGQSVREAIINGGERRLRPVLMTTLTTVFGLAPLAFIPTEGSEMWAPLGVAVIGGLLFSTMVTLILVPVIYSGFERATERRRQKKERRGNS
ncbi:MMPL family transporter, partial [candidate division WOR-3 bacterium]|nr:MMPL family transporter [candidate division WOR-3 bacterium]MBD3364796.1 MMPL family transporter [candidate division WOR-3 bacterium]